MYSKMMGVMEARDKIGREWREGEREREREREMSRNLSLYG